VWREQPVHVAYVDDGLLTRFSGHDAGRRRPGSGLADLHAYSEAARALYLDASVHAWMELLLGEPAIALQSRFFEWSGEQALRRDSTDVRMEPADLLLSAWIACEDIAPENGPLVCVPGSHRLPACRRDSERSDGTDDSLAARSFTLRRGEVWIRHPSLLHGGSAPADPARTRKTFVARFAPRGQATSTASSYLDPFVPSVVAAAPTPRVYATDRLLGAHGPQGFDSPLRVRALAENAELHRAVAHLLALLAERDATLARLDRRAF
jgi:hypothetical protein